jgi:hypothetical protein
MPRCEAALSPYSKGYQMENEEVTNPAEEVAVSDAPTPEVTDESETELLGDETSDESAEEEITEEFIDIEKDGKTYKVPKSIEDLLMFQKDYTQKTQTLAEQRRELEAQRQATQWEAETKEALFHEKAQLVTVQQRLAQFRDVNWQALAQQDMQQYAVLQAEYTQLKDVHDGLSRHVEGREAELAQHREQSRSTALTKALEVLNKPDPSLGWDGKFDADKRSTLTKFGMQLGFTNEELTNTSHPRMIQTLNLARIGYEALQKQAATLKKQQPQATPVPQVKSGKSRPGVFNPDTLPPEQWVKWREKQIAKNRAS